MASLCTLLPQLSPGETGGPKFRRGSACLALRNGESVKEKKEKNMFIYPIREHAILLLSQAHIQLLLDWYLRLSLFKTQSYVSVYSWVSSTQLYPNSRSPPWSSFSKMPVCLPFSLPFRPQREATIAQLGVFVPICHCLSPFRILRLKQYSHHHHHHHYPSCPFGTQSHSFVTLKPTIDLWGSFSYSPSLQSFY